VTLPAGGGEPVRTVQLGRDLRDVVVLAGEVFVTRFRTAELLRVDPQTGASDSRGFPRMAFGFGGGDVLPGEGPPGGAPAPADGAGFVPDVAWRAIGAPNGRIAMVHQRASGSPVQPQPGGYGGGTSCLSSIVQSSVTFFGWSGAITAGPDLAGATLPVDIAISPDGSRTAVVAAGNQSGALSVLVYQTEWLESVPAETCLFHDEQPEVEVPNAIAAAYAPTRDGYQLVVQQRDPARLFIFEGASADGFELRLLRTVELGGASRFDTGHALFHANSGSFIACASCHPEGGDDGRTWNFGRIGPRRTPAIHGDLRGTEPFHWDGDMRDLGHLVSEVFTGRMSGPALSPRQVDALGAWLDELPRPVVAMPSDNSAVERGRTLFYGEAQCAACHSGPLYTNNATVDVGTGGAFQVPSLIGVSFRLPVMHSGCARTLRDRFEPGCGGGDAHGRTSHLTEAQIQDLIAFLETL
jgi:mono/diheme cytochrome c family protein